MADYFGSVGLYLSFQILLIQASWVSLLWFQTPFPPLPTQNSHHFRPNKRTREPINRYLPTTNETRQGRNNRCSFRFRAITRANPDWTSFLLVPTQDLGKTTGNARTKYCPMFCCHALRRGGSIWRLCTMSNAIMIRESASAHCCPTPLRPKPKVS